MKRFYLLILSSLLTTILQATTYYVSNSGNNNNTGLSLSDAWATIQYASDQVVAGDSVMVTDGTYTGFYVDESGSSTDPIVFKAIGNNAVINQPNSFTNQDGINIENCNWVIIDGFDVIDQPRAGIRIAEADNCTIRNNYCNNNGVWGIFSGFAENLTVEYNECSYSQEEHGIYLSNSADNPIIRYNICHHNYVCGIQLNGDASLGGDGVISNAEIVGNIIYENGQGGGSAINCDGVNNSTIINNLMYKNHASGISLYKIDGGASSTDNKVFNNTIINASDARWCINIKNGSTGNTIINNILINLHSFRGSISVSSNSLTNFSSDYNIVVNSMSNDGGNTTMTLVEWQVLGYDTHSMLADALLDIFVDTSSGDYHLKVGSQAIDTGSSSVAGIVLYDLDQNSRPQGTDYDIGAYEYLDPLPIRLLSFKVSIHNQKIVLHWQTAMEHNNKGVGIEQSSDGKVWEHIGYVKSKAKYGNSNRSLKYTYSVEPPLIGMNYFRLKQLDYDGQYEYSAIRSVYFSDVESISVYPNPAINYFNICGLSGGESITIYDNRGRLVRNFTVFHSGSQKISIAELPVGHYIIQIILNRKIKDEFPLILMK